MMWPMTANRTDSSRTAGPRHAALAAAVAELEEHVARRGWDAPVAVFALVRTAEALAQEPTMARLLDAQSVSRSRTDPEALTVIEQEHLPAAADLEDLLGQLAWPQEVDGVALAVERVTVPAAAEAEAASIEDPEQRIAYLAARPDRDEVRIVVGVLRSGEAWCAVRSRSHDDPASVVTGDALVPGLVDALRATLE